MSKNCWSECCNNNVVKFCINLETKVYAEVLQPLKNQMLRSLCHEHIRVSANVMTLWAMLRSNNISLF